MPFKLFLKELSKHITSFWFLNIGDIISIVRWLHWQELNLIFIYHIPLF
jgi:hypothetical protein